MKQDESDGHPKFIAIIGFGNKLSSHWKKKTKENLENKEEYIGLTETPYRNLMLDRQVMQIEERLAGHRLFLP